MTKILSVIVVVLLFSSKPVFADRVIYLNADSASAISITLFNPSTVAQRVKVNFQAAGPDRINNAFVANLFGVCADATCATYYIPHGGLLTCNPGYTNCNNTATPYTLNPGSSIRMGIGCVLSLIGCNYGCQAKFNKDATSGVMVTVTIEGDAGFLTGSLNSFDDLTNSIIIQPIMGGRAF